MAFLEPQAVVGQMPIINGDHILDIGCGLGAFALAVAERYSHAHVTAMDIDIDKLDILAANTLRLQHLNVHTLKCDIAEAWPIETLTIDGAIVANILHIFKNDKIDFILSELHRVMKPHAMAVVIEWKSDDNIDTTHSMAIGPRDHAIGEAEMLEILKRNGFVVKANIPAGVYHYGLLIESI